MKKFLVFILLLSTFFIFAGCSSETTEETVPADESTSEIALDEWEEEEATPPVPEGEAKAIAEETAAIEVKPIKATPKVPTVVEMPKSAAPEKNNDEELIQSIKKAFAADGCSAS